MHSDSRKAQRNSFAHHRAEHLFSIERMFAGDTAAWSAGDVANSGSTDLYAEGQRPRGGLPNFVPMAPSA